jgi:hypothetical protein
VSWAGRALWHLTLPWTRPPLMANDGSSLRVSFAEKANCRDSVRTLARSLRLDPVAVPVVAVLTYYPGTNHTIDPDNIAPTLKRCLDGLQLAGVLANDSGRHVVLTAQRVVPLDLDPFGKSRGRVVLSLYDGTRLELPHILPSPSATLSTELRSP